MPLDITCVSDLHGHYPKLPGGDLLIVAGDLTARDTQREHEEFLLWMGKQNYKKKVMIAGNHDNFHKETPSSNILLIADYLCDSGTEFEGLKIWGSPWTSTFPDMNPRCKAFTVDTEEELAEKWALIPGDVDILITHSPPYDYLDHIRTEYDDRWPAGSLSLYEKITDIYPRLHVFGHIHEGYGTETKDFYHVYGSNEITFINASHVNEHYKPVNVPIRVQI